MTSPVVGRVTLEAGIDTDDLKKELQSQLRKDLFKDILPQIQKVSDEINEASAAADKMSKTSFKDLARQLNVVADAQRKIAKAKKDEADAERALSNAKADHKDKVADLADTQARLNKQIKESGKATEATERSYQRKLRVVDKALRTIADKEAALHSARSAITAAEIADQEHQIRVTEKFRVDQIAGFQKVINANRVQLNQLIRMKTTETNRLNRLDTAAANAEIANLNRVTKARDTADAKAFRRAEREARRRRSELREALLSPATGAGEIGRAAFNLSPKTSTGAFAATLGGAGLLAGGAASLSKTLIAVPAMATAAAAGITTLQVATKGLGDTFKALSSGDMRLFAEEFKKLSPQAQDLVLQYQGMLPKLGEIRKRMQDALLLNTDDMLFGLSEAYLPVLDKLGTRISSSFNRMMQKATDELMKPGTQKQIGTITDNIGKAFERLEPIIQPLIQAFLDLSEVGSGFLPGMADMLVNAARDFAAFIREAKESGKLAQWFSEGMSMLGTVIDLVKTLGKFFLALAPIAEKVLPYIAHFLESIVDFLSDHPTALFDVIALFIGASVGKGVWNLVKGFSELKKVLRELGMLRTGTAVTDVLAQAGAGGVGGPGGVAGKAGKAGKLGRIGGVAGLLRGGVGLAGGGLVIGGLTGATSGVVGQDKDSGGGKAINIASMVGGGALLGGTIGSFIAPGLGTAIGAGIGAAGGGVAVGVQKLIQSQSDTTEKATEKAKDYAAALQLSTEAQTDLSAALIMSGGAWDSSAVAQSKEQLATDVDALRVQSEGAAKILTDRFGPSLRGLDPLLRNGGPGFDALVKNIKAMGGPDADKAVEFLRNFRTNLSDTAALSANAAAAFRKLLGEGATEDQVIEKISEIKELVDALPDNKPVTLSTPEGTEVFNTIQKIGDQLEKLPTGEVRFKVAPNAETEAFLATIEGLILGPNNILLYTTLDQASFDAAQKQLGYMFNFDVNENRQFQQQPAPPPGAPAAPPGVGALFPYGIGGTKRAPQTKVPDTTAADTSKAATVTTFQELTDSQLRDQFENQFAGALAPGAEGGPFQVDLSNMAGQPGQIPQNVNVENFPDLYGTGGPLTTSAPTGTGGIPLMRGPNGTWTSPDPAWAHLIQRESGGNASIIQGVIDANTGGNEASGLFQIAKNTWAENGGLAFAPTAGQASPEQQAAIAAKIFQARGGQPWGAGLAGREDEGALRAGLTGAPGVVRPLPGGGPGGTGGLTFGGPYNFVPAGTNIAAGDTGFPTWVYELGRQFNVTPSTYGGHQDASGFERGIDWTGTDEDLTRFAKYLAGINNPAIGQVIYESGTGEKIGVAGGQRTDDFYYRDDWAGHKAGTDKQHVHTRFENDIASFSRALGDSTSELRGGLIKDQYGNTGRMVVDQEQVKKLNAETRREWEEWQKAFREAQTVQGLFDNPIAGQPRVTQQELNEALGRVETEHQEYLEATDSLKKAAQGTFEASEMQKQAAQSQMDYYESLPFGNLEKMIHAGIIGGGGTDQNVSALMAPILTALGQPAGANIQDIFSPFLDFLFPGPGTGRLSGGPMPTAPSASVQKLAAEGSPMAAAAAAGLPVPDYGRQGGGAGAGDLLTGQTMRDAMGRMYSDTAALIDRTATDLRAQDEARHEQVMGALRAIAARVGADILTPTISAGVTAGLDTMGNETANRIGIGMGESAAPIIASAIAQVQAGQVPQLTPEQLATVQGALANIGNPQLFDNGGEWASGTAGLNMSGSTERVLSPDQTSLFNAGLLGGWNLLPRRSMFATQSGESANASVGGDFFGVGDVPILGPVADALIGVLLQILGVEIESRDTLNELTDEFRDFRGDQFRSFDAAGRMMNDTSALLDRSGTDEETVAQERMRILTQVLKGLVDFVMKFLVEAVSALANAALSTLSSVIGAVITASNPFGFLIAPIVTALIGAAGGGLVELLGGAAASIAGALSTLLFGGGVFDSGGVAYGAGFIPKATIKPERVLSPSTTIAFDRMVAALERGNGDFASSRTTTIYAPFTVQGGAEAGRAAHGRLLALMS